MSEKQEKKVRTRLGKNHNKTPEEIAEILAKRVEYKRQYQRRYYTEHKDGDDFKHARRLRSRRAYKYARKTIDCATCGVRHRADNQNCLLLREARKNSKIHCLLDALDNSQLE